MRKIYKGRTPINKIKPQIISLLKWKSKYVGHRGVKLKAETHVKPTVSQVPNLGIIVLSFGDFL